MFRERMARVSEAVLCHRAEGMAAPSVWRLRVGKHTNIPVSCSGRVRQTSMHRAELMQVCQAGGRCLFCPGNQAFQRRPQQRAWMNALSVEA